MAAFPSYAKILRDGFGEQRETALMRTEMESGPPRQVKVRSRVLVSRPVRIFVETKADYLAFVSWFRDTLNEGADWFDWLDPVDGTTKSVRFAGGGMVGEPAGSVNTGWFISGLKLEGWGV